MVLRCTVKALKLLDARLRDLVTAEPTDQDWYANLIWLERRKCLLLAHAGTLFSVVVLDVRKADLVPIGPSIAAFIRQELEAEELPLGRFGALDSGIALARTESRSILGYMMARFCEYSVVETGLGRTDVRKLNRELSRELHLSRKPPGTLSRSSSRADQGSYTPSSPTDQLSGFLVDAC